MKAPKPYSLTNPNLHQAETLQGAVPPLTVNLTCPHCSRVGAFTPLPNISDLHYGKQMKLSAPTNNLAPHAAATLHAGWRICPNLECKGLVAVIVGYSHAEGLRWVAPPEVIDFRVDNIPAKIVQSMREAITSHSGNAYRAAALMVRRTLELLCEDKKAQGADLKARLTALAQHVVLSPALLDAADNLRLLGNDAAHVEAKNYDDVDEAHSQIAIELTKEILKAVYQHDDLVARLKKLQRP